MAPLSESEEENLRRREFLSAAAAALAGDAAQPAKFPFGPRRMIGIQVGAISFVDEGIEQVLDILQQRARVNTVFLATFTYGRGIAGRQVPGQPLPDHGKQEYDLDFHGGNYAAVHPEFYKDTVLKRTRAPDHGELDIVAAVLPAARRRGLKLVCWFEDVWRKDVPGIEQCQERDLYGRPAATLCFNNPNVRNFWLALVEDYARCYNPDGLMWGCERMGPLGNALGMSHGGAARDPGRVTCFCPFCERRARQSGINPARAREGYLALESWVRAARAARRPGDGYFVSFWRLLLRYPEILAWETLWTDSLRETYSAMYQKAKSIRPAIAVGWHIWHNNSFSPIYRAEQDLAELAKHSDFLKIVMYHNCGGERMAGYISSVSRSLWADFSPEEALQLHYRLLNYQEGALEQIPQRGLSADYVARETRRALAAVAGAPTLIWPGIDIDIPTDARHSKSTPEGTRAAVLAALKAGADGVLLSRKYSEMRLANLSAAGEAVSELGLV